MAITQRPAIATSAPLPAPSIDAPGRHRAPAALLVLIASLACTGNATGPRVPDVSGVYSFMQRNSADSCSPRPLPPPLLPDSSQYVFPSTMNSAPFRFLLEFQQKDTQLVIYFLDSVGTRIPGLPVMRGVVAADGSYSDSLEYTQGVEGPRAGGHTFAVVNTMTEGGRFETNAGRTTLTDAGMWRTAFHEQAPRGAVYTTCSFTFTATATRIDLRMMLSMQGGH